MALVASINQLPHQGLDIVAVIIAASVYYTYYHDFHNNCSVISDSTMFLEALRRMIHVINTHVLRNVSWHNTCIESYTDGLPWPVDHTSLLLYCDLEVVLQYGTYCCCDNSTSTDVYVDDKNVEDGVMEVVVVALNFRNNTDTIHWMVLSEDMGGDIALHIQVGDSSASFLVEVLQRHLNLFGYSSRLDNNHVLDVAVTVYVAVPCHVCLAWRIHAAQVELVILMYPARLHRLEGAVMSGPT